MFITEFERKIATFLLHTVDDTWSLSRGSAQDFVTAVNLAVAFITGNLQTGVKT